MKLRKNAFYYFALVVFMLCMVFAIGCVMRRMGDGQEYPYLLKGEWLLGTMGVVLLLLGGGALGARLRVREKLDAYPKLALIAECLLAAVLLVIGLALRLKVINELPMAPNSDYKTYYEIAELLHRDVLVEEGIGYCDYVSMFPHVFGYPAVLSWVFGLFGVSVRTALMFNLVMQMAGCALVWRIGRLAMGRVCGLVSLALSVFLPSAILYSNFVASEPLFTFLLLLGIWLFALSLSGKGHEKHPWLCVTELALLGVALAFASFVRPMAVIFLVAAVICLLPGKKELPALPRNDIPLGWRASDKGWKRCLILGLVYLLTSSLFTMGTGYAVNRELAGSSSSYGYNLLVGLNLESYGGWNQEDADYLYASLDATGSAQEAQLTSRDMALERLKVDPRALLNLFVHKFEVLWGNDDYGASWNILFMDQQGNLTPERESFLYRMMDVSDLYYLWLLAGGGLFGVFMFRRKPDVLYACTLLFCGTVALHLLVENQNRYHYHALPLLALFSGASVSVMLGVVRRTVLARIEQKKREEAEKVEREAAVRARQRDDDERVRLRAEALHAQFDMGKAILEGHVRVVASEGVMKNAVGLVVPETPAQPTPAPAQAPKPELEKPEPIAVKPPEPEPVVEKMPEPEPVIEETQEPEPIAEQVIWPEPEPIEEEPAPVLFIPEPVVSAPPEPVTPEPVPEEEKPRKDKDGKKKEKKKEKEKEKKNDGGAKDKKADKKKEKSKDKKDKKKKHKDD